ncbi:hypothetical protein WDV76_03475 [Xenorhabdus griffiniae]|uniref:hypothetical protein n=1 Tax=Xenorhabdus griffiniae TaxID=351672 RepID=UPI0030CE9281
MPRGWAFVIFDTPTPSGRFSNDSGSIPLTPYHAVSCASLWASQAQPDFVVGRVHCALIAL